MSVARYLPATRTKARSRRLGPLSVRTSDNRELGRLMGFVVDTAGRHVWSLVMEVVDARGSQQVELPMVPMCFDAEAQALRMVEPDAPAMLVFRPESVSDVEEADLSIPIVPSAA